MHLSEHWKTEAVRPPFLCRFQAVFQCFDVDPRPFCHAFVPASVELVSIPLNRSVSCAFPASFQRVAQIVTQEKSGRFWAASVAFLGASRRIIPNFLPRLWNLRFYSYLWVSEIRFPPEKYPRNSGKFTRSFFRFFSNLLNIKSRSDTVTPVCYENYEGRRYLWNYDFFSLHLRYIQPYISGEPEP